MRQLKEDKMNIVCYIQKVRQYCLLDSGAKFATAQNQFLLEYMCTKLDTARVCLLCIPMDPHLKLHALKCNLIS
jgi:hypothetical protein